MNYTARVNNTALEAAWGELGVAELAGAAHEPRILEYHSVTGGWSRDEVPWCGSFVAWCVGEGLPERPALARGWLEWGAECDAVLGAVCVIKRKRKGSDARTGSRAGYHVGFYVNRTRGGIVMLSGNAQDRVGIDPYFSRSYEVMGYRVAL